MEYAGYEKSFTRLGYKFYVLRVLFLHMQGVRSMVGVKPSGRFHLLQRNYCRNNNDKVAWLVRDYWMSLLGRGLGASKADGQGR